MNGELAKDIRSRRIVDVQVMSQSSSARERSREIDWLIGVAAFSCIHHDSLENTNDNTQ